MKAAISFGLLLGLISSLASAQGSTELTCRAQAKEVAAQAYSGCITEARNSRVDEIRRNYEKDLMELKTKYDQELKSLGQAVPTADVGGAVKAPKKTTPATAVKAAKVAAKGPKASISSRPAKSIAQKLPAKQTATREALPMYTGASESQAIAVGSSSSGGSESSSDLQDQERPSKGDQFEIVEMPAIEE